MSSPGTNQSSPRLLWLGLALIVVPGAAYVGVAIYESRAIAGAVLALACMAFGVGLVLRDCRNIGRVDAARHESEERFHFFVQAVTDYAIYMLDPRGYVTSWNAGAERIKGYAAGEIIGQHFSRDNVVPFQPAGLPATKEWIQIDRADAADYEKDLELFRQSLDFVKGGGR